MRKFTLNLLILFLAASYSFAGGIVTNTNQSSAWVRLLVRDATTEIDAVYFNPAGLTKLNDGFHFSISNQYITQEKDVLNSYSFLNERTLEKLTDLLLFRFAFKNESSFSGSYNDSLGAPRAISLNLLKATFSCPWMTYFPREFLLTRVWVIFLWVAEKELTAKNPF